MGLAAKWVSVSNGYMWRGAWSGPGCQVGKCQQWSHCGEGPGARLAAKWVSVSNGHMWRGAWGGPGCQVGKCQQWLYIERSLGRAWLPSG